MAARTVIVGPQSFEAWNLLGSLSIKRGEYDHAVSHFYRAVRSATVDDPRIAMNLARAQHMSEDWLAAKTTYEAVAARSPRHYPAHFELACLYLNSNQPNRAAPFLQAVAELAPFDWPLLQKLNTLLTANQHWALAIAFQKRIAARGGEDSTHWFRLFETANAAGDPELAGRALRRILLLQPSKIRVWEGLVAPHLINGACQEMTSLFRVGVKLGKVSEVILIRWAYYLRSQEAPVELEMLIQTADRLAIRHARLAPFRAWLMTRTDDLTALGKHVTEFVRDSPDDVNAWNELGLVVEASGDQKETRKFFRRARQKFPDHLVILHNLAQAEVDCDNLAAGWGLTRKILLRDPQAFRSLNLLAFIKGEYDHFHEAVKCFHYCLTLKPGWSAALLNLGLYLLESGDRLGAVRSMRAAIETAGGDNPKAAYNLALELIASGEIVEGYRLYRARWTTKGFLSELRPLPQPEWPGPVAAPRSSLALFMEQGMGDEVMYSWYLPWVAADTRSLTVECDRRLIPTFERSFPQISFVPRENPLRPILAATEIDYQSAAANMPEFYADTLADVIQKQRVSPELLGQRHSPRLIVDPDRLTHWRRYLKATFGDRPCLGIVWRSALRNHKRDKQYVTPSQLTAALPPGVGLVNLQYSCEAEEVVAFSTLGARHDFQFETPPGIDLKDDLDDLFALIQCLDGVVGPLISVPWMAAAVGTPAFVIRTEAKGYIWQQLNTPHVPWAPSMRLFFRSPTAPWETVLETVKQALIREFFSPT